MLRKEIVVITLCKDQIVESDSLKERRQPRFGSRFKGTQDNWSKSQMRTKKIQFQKTQCGCINKTVEYEPGLKDLQIKEWSQTDQTTDKEVGDIGQTWITDVFSSVSAADSVIDSWGVWFKRRREGEKFKKCASELLNSRLMLICLRKQVGLESTLAIHVLRWGKDEKEKKKGSSANKSWMFWHSKTRNYKPKNVYFMSEDWFIV